MCLGTFGRLARSLATTVTVHAYVPSNGICRGFAFKYSKFLLPPRFLTALLKLPGIDLLF